MNRPSIVFWRRTSIYYLIGGLVVLLIASVISYALTTFQSTTVLRLGTGVYHVRVADNDPERIQGLSGVKGMLDNQGLLMIFDEPGEWGIWMKDMEMALDIVWLDENKEVIYARTNVSPDIGTTHTFTPDKPAKYVVELSAGTVAKSGITLGTVAQFDETEMKGIGW